MCVRHKTFPPEGMTVDEAVFDFEAMDGGLYLFCDLATGQDSLVHRHLEGYRPSRCSPRPTGLRS